MVITKEKNREYRQKSRGPARPAWRIRHSRRAGEAVHFFGYGKDERGYGVKECFFRIH